MNNIKKVMAIATGAAFLGATIMGAMAYDLSNYPAPFVEDGVAAGAIVVGANAATTDVLGAIDIAASLQAEAVTATEVAGSAAVAVTGGEKVDDIVLADASQAFGTYDKNDLEGFADTDFNFDDTDYRYEDMVSMANGAVEFEPSTYDEDFGKDVYGVIEDPSEIQYLVKIDKDFNYSEVNKANTDNDKYIEFNFLGKTVKVTKFGDTNEMTIEGSSEFFMEQGDVVTVDGHEVTLKRVGTAAVLVTVDGQTLTIASGHTEKFDQADNFEVEANSIFYIEGATDNSATLKMGTSISKTVKDGDSAELFGEPSDEDEADWLWVVNMSDDTSAYSYVGLKLNIERTDLSANEADERNAMAPGDSIDFPNNYASIDYTGSQIDNFAKLGVKIDNRIDVSEKDNGASLHNVWGFHFTTDTGDEDFVVGTTKTDEVWAVYPSDNSAVQVWYKDGSDEVKTSASAFNMTLDNEAVTVTPIATINSSNGVESALTYSFPTAGTAETFTLGANYSKDFFGTDDSDNGNDFTGTFNGKTISGSTEYDGGYVMMNYGSYFQTPKEQFGSGDTFEIYVPTEQQKVTVAITSKGSVVSAGSEGGMSYSVNPIALGLGMLDTAANVGSKPMIIIGGPAANTAAAEVMGNPTPEVIAETFQEGKAIIKYYNDKQAMLVAGWGAQDTLGAAYVVAKHADYDFTGNELEVVVTDLSNIEVSAIQ